MSDRAHENELIDRLPEPQLSPLLGLRETTVDPVGAALRKAPVDNEPDTEEEKQAVAEPRGWLAQNGGKRVPHREAMRGLGLE